MMGVNINNIENITKKNNFHLSSFNSDSAKLLEIIKELKECYNGSGLDFLFNEPINEEKNIKKISSVIESYSNVLVEVKRGYQQQDINLKNQVNRMNSNV